MSNISGISASALAAYGTKQGVTANNLANINVPDFKASDTVMKESAAAGGVTAAVVKTSDSVDISKEAVDLLSTSTNYSANLKALKVSDQMMKNALDLVK